MTLETYLKEKIQRDFFLLYKSYINDELNPDEKEYWKEKQRKLTEMTLEELMKENTEYVFQHELSNMMKGYFDEFLEKELNDSELVL